MAEKELHYITDELSQQVEQIALAFINGDTEQTPQEFLADLKNVLPIDKMKQKTVLVRVEGLLIATDLLWKSLLKDGSMTRNEIVSQANIRTMSHYQYITGSRTPVEFLKKRSDFYNDPSTALAKLQDDAIRLTGFMLKLRTKATM